MPTYKNRFSSSTSDKPTRKISVQPGYQVRATINGSPLDQALKNNQPNVAVGCPERNWDDSIPIEFQDGSYTP